MRVKLSSIPTGDQGTRRTVALISRNIGQGRTTPEVRRLAVALLNQAHVQRGDGAAEITTLFDFVRSRLRYVPDPVDTEFVGDALAVLEIGGGDCDDLAVLLGSLLESIGHRVRVKISSEYPDQDFSHVYLEVFHSGEWIPLDPSAPGENVRPGWETPLRGRQEVFGLGETSTVAGQYPFQAVDTLLNRFPVSFVQRMAWENVSRAILSGDVTRADIVQAREWLQGEGFAVMSARQRRMLADLLSRSLRIAADSPGLGGLRIGHWFGNVWDGIKKAIRTLGQIAGTVGPLLVVIPGIGPATAAIVTTAGRTVYQLTAESGQVLGYAPINATLTLDDNGNYILDPSFMTPAASTGKDAGKSNWLWYAAAGVLALVILTR